MCYNSQNYENCKRGCGTGGQENYRFFLRTPPKPVEVFSGTIGPLDPENPVVIIYHKSDGLRMANLDGSTGEFVFPELLSTQGKKLYLNTQQGGRGIVYQSIDAVRSGVHIDYPPREDKWRIMKDLYREPND